MKYFSIWQPLRNEDAHTALVFGFLRHAPTESALNPWLTAALGRSVTADPLDPEAFWPSFGSVVDDHQRTEPELVFSAADDAGPLSVIVEAKPGFGQHTDAQVTREIVDVATGRGASRIALIMLGADRFEPTPVSEWRQQLRRALELHQLGPAQVELHYSSWADLGAAIIACATKASAWAAYAEDVAHQLRNQGLLGYDGGPVFDDLDGLTVPNAVEVFNRTVKTAKNLLLTLESQESLRSSGVTPWAGAPRLTMDGGIGKGGLSRADWEFETSMIMSAYTKPNWPDGAGIYVAVWLTPDEGEQPELHAGAFCAPRYELSDLVWAYANDVEGTDDVRARTDALDRADTTLLDHLWADSSTEWVFGKREWLPKRGDEDLHWLLECLAAATWLWDRA